MKPHKISVQTLVKEIGVTWRDKEKGLKEGITELSVLIVDQIIVVKQTKITQSWNSLRLL